MRDRPRLVPVPATREPLSLLAVDRAVADLRRGLAVAVQGPRGTAALVMAAEAVTEERLSTLADRAGAEPVLAMTARRAAVLGLVQSSLKIVRIEVAKGLIPSLIHDLCDPVPDRPLPAEAVIRAHPVEPHGCESAAVRLCKTARLLPAAVAAPIADPDAADLRAWAARRDLLLVDAGDVFQYDHIAARFLRPVSEAWVPLHDAETTRVIAFRPRDGGLEHLALVFGEPQADRPVLTRLHSECFTGDLLASLRCDCGDQLRGAIREIAAAGGGVLLYLAQEGRGIGLVNKLRAYTLQDRGFDTLEANEQLGFDADERIYLPAAEILRQLGFTRVRLLTNNPGKVAGLSQCGVTVEERVPHAFPSNRHNEIYLRTKLERGGHLT